MTLQATIPLGGELAALATALLWSFSALAWSLAGRRIGAPAVTSIRIALATVMLAGAHWVVFGAPWPEGLDWTTLLLLAASGVSGAGIGDLLLFHGFVLVGPRIGMLILSLAPVLAAWIAYLTPLREGLGPVSILGMALTIGGVAWVVWEGDHNRAWKAPPGRFGEGVAFALGGAALIAVGYVLSKMGMTGRGEGVDPFSATLVRVAAATVVTWAALPVLGKSRSTMRALADAKVMLIVVGGTIVGPVLGIWLSMVAIKWSQTGVATAIISTSPIMMIPIAYAAYREKPTARSVIGTCVAVAGVALLMLRGHLE